MIKLILLKLSLVKSGFKVSDLYLIIWYKKWFGKTDIIQIVLIEPLLDIKLLKHGWVGDAFFYLDMTCAVIWGTKLEAYI